MAITSVLFSLVFVSAMVANANSIIIQDQAPDQFYNWSVVVYTGKKRYSGTNDDVYLSIYGNRTWTPSQKLDSPNDAFKLSARDVFSVRTKRIIPTKIKVALRGRDGWFVSRVELHRKDKTGTVYVFPFNHMLDNSASMVVHVQNPDGYPLCKWHVRIWTGSHEHSGTRSIVYIELFGGRKRTGFYELPRWNHIYKKGAENTFPLKTYCLEPTRIAIKLSGRDSWFLHRIELQRTDNMNKKFIFPFYDWVRGGLVRHFVDVSTSKGKGYCAWFVGVWTSYRRYAGTNDDVRIKIYGSGSSTSAYKLDSKKNGFVQGAFDKFGFESKCLTPTKIKIWQTGEDGWYLQMIRLTRRDTNEDYLFICNGWLDDSKAKVLTLKS